MNLPQERSHRTHCGEPRGFGGSRRARWRIASLVLVHVAVAAHVAHWKLSGRSLSPMEPSEAGETFTLGYVNAGFLVLAASVGLTLVLGRLFCGWACHVVAYQDLCAALLAKLGLRPRPLRSRLLVWVPLLAAFEMFALPTLLDLARGQALPSPSLRLTTDELWARFPGPGMAALTIAVDGFLLVWLLGAKGFCTYGCPYGALFGLADRFARRRIRVSPACDGCGHCTAVCTSNVRVHEEVAHYRQVVDAGCMKCMDCVSACPKGALSYEFGASRASALAGKPPPRARATYDFGWGEEWLLALVFLGALFAFRNLYGAVPFLLAIGLALVTALATALLLRLVRSAELRFQNHVLKSGGRFTLRGATAFGGSALLASLAAHSALVQVHARAGESALERAAALPRGSAERAAEIDEAQAQLERAYRFGLFTSARLENQLGQIALERGDGPEAERRLRRAAELEPGWESPRVLLADELARQGRFDDAVRELVALLRERPGSRAAIERMAKALARDAAVERELESLAPGTALSVRELAATLRAR